MLLSPLRHRDFRIFWIGLLLSSIGSQFTTVAMAWQIYELTNSPLQIGLIGLVRAVPQVAMLLFGGLLADAMDRRVLLIIASCGLAVASVLLWVEAALALNNVWLVLCLLSVQQAFYAINAPTRSAAIPRMLPAISCPPRTR